ncbi:hypothetical protein [Nitratireductor sp. XY-223]|uniref:hypothetical protein n=1 Tax=Nitratireductor sp. XY-223 TaxID=2561926 RepID=UPI0010AAE3C4|nr:hypothetical protein [Nitratireductor sp. XY-223]
MDKIVNIETLKVLRQARTAFHDQLCRLSKESDPRFLRHLRHDNVFVFVEFFFLLNSFELTQSPEKFESYVRNHNEQISKLVENRDQRGLMGLEVPRLKRGLFSDDQIEKAKANLMTSTPGLDQADMQRLMITLFSHETARQVLENLETAGFMTRIATPYKSKIIQSSGIAEDAYLDYLEYVRSQMPR